MFLELSFNLKSKQVEHVRKVDSKIIGSNLPTLHYVYQSKAMANMELLLKKIMCCVTVLISLNPVRD